MSSFQKRLSSVESVAGDNFERLTVAEASIKMLQTQNQSLADRCDDLENRCRLRVMHGDDRLTFDSPDEAQQFIDRAFGKD